MGGCGGGVKGPFQGGVTGDFAAVTGCGDEGEFVGLEEWEEEGGGPAGAENEDVVHFAASSCFHVKEVSGVVRR